MSERQPTTKFKVDISELKKGMQEAQRQIRLANSEFKAATSGMDKWSDSADGVSAKMKQLGSVLDAEKKKLASLEAQYDLVAKEQGETSKGAQELLIKINNQKAAIGQTEASLSKYGQKLSQIKAEQTKAASAFDKLGKEIEKQENDLSSLKKAYANAVLEFGDTSKEAKDLGKQIDTLSRELSKNKKSMSDAQKGADDLDRSLEDTRDAARDTEEGFSVMKVAIGNLIADGLKALAKSAVETMGTLVVETEKAYGSFQAQTGASTKEMKEFKKEIDELYKNNYGDSIQDVADAMAEVKKQTNETDPSKLKQLTENAIALRDTFDMDVKESMRAVNMLMEQFGISGDEAYNLIVQGAQNGLDKNGDLLDTINEYGVHYRQLGYDADEFFNSLSNGTKAGTFSVDKLGDAMKEFGIRTKDTATTSQEGFELLGYGASVSAEEVGKTKDQIAKLEQNLKYAKMEQKEFNSKTSELTKMKNADKIKEYSKQLEEAKGKLKGMSGETKNSSGSVKELQKRFAAGGETAKKATKEVLEKLMNMDDKVKQNQAGVDLFGTMWEDLGIEGVKALMETNGTLDMTKKSMEEMKKVKYDNIASQFATIGRSLQMDFLVPLAEKALPYVKDFAEYTTTHLEEVVTVIKLVGGAIATVFIVNKVATFTQSIMTMVTAFGTLKTATEGATVAQRILNLVQKANPIGLLITAVGALTLGLVAYASSVEKTETVEDKLIKKHDETRKSVDELEKSYKQVTDARDKTVSNAQAQFGYYQNLKNELDGLVDKNGKVKKSEQDRASFIMTTLNEALGTELKLTKDGTTNYLDQKKALDSLIETKKAQIILDANEGAYTEAINNKTKAFQNLQQAQADLKETTSKLEEAQNKLKDAKSNETLKEYIETFGQTAGVTKYERDLNAAKEAVSKLEGEQKKNQKTITDSENKWKDYNAVIENYEGLSSAIISGDTKKINNALDNMVNNFISAKVGTKAQLEDQVKNMKKNYSDLQKAVKAGTPGVTQEMVDSAKKMVDKSENELDKLTPKAKKSGEKSGKAAADGVKSKTQNAEAAGKEVSKSTQKGMESENTKKSGEKKAGDFNKGVESKKEDAKKKGKDVSKKAKEGLDETKTKSSGTNFVQGFIDGVNGKTTDGSLFTSVSNMAGKAIKWLNEKLDEHSPSKETEKSGKYFTEGFAIGVSSEVDGVLAIVGNLAVKSLKTLLTANKSGEYEKAGEKAVIDFERGMEKQISSAEKTVKSLVNKAVKQAKKSTKDKKTQNAFSKLGTSMVDSFSKAFDKASEKALKKVESKLDSITESYQSKYDSIKELQESLEETYSSGDLFSEDENGQITLTDFASETKKIEKLGSNLKNLKGKLSSELMSEITKLGTEDQLKLTNKLLSLSDTELKAYNSAYTNKLKASQKVASDYYSGQLKNLKKNYTEKVEKEMKKLDKKLEKIGQSAIEGFLKGFGSKDKETTKAVKSFTDSLVKKLKKELGIHSPSRVMRDMIGKFIPSGVAAGIKANTKTAVRAMEGMANSIVKPMKTSLSSVNIDGSSGISTGSGKSVTNVYNTFNQTNNSPKALSRWDIYRQSKNLLRGVQNV